MSQATFRGNLRRRFRTAVRTTYLVMVVGLVSGSVYFAAASQAQTVTRITLQDESDWWSDSRPGPEEDNGETQERAPSDSTYRILALNLTEQVLEDAAAKLGKVTLVERGGGTDYSRTQACYVSAGGSSRVFLVFENASFPGGPGFYLFLDGAPWKGIDLCRKSPLVTTGLATASGLHLGQSPSQVLALLGKPSLRRKDELFYVFHAHMERPASELKKERESNPQMSDDEFHSKFAVYDLEATVHVRFVDSKLTYLAVSKAEID